MERMMNRCNTSRSGLKFIDVNSVSLRWTHAKISIKKTEYSISLIKKDNNKQDKANRKKNQKRREKLKNVEVKIKLHDCIQG